jgi:uncharacterized protein YndB with AHSA1/START domain
MTGTDDLDLDPELDLVLTRDIDAPRAILWQCWTTPEHLVHWFVPEPHRVTACQLDLRTGGACNTTFEVDGTEVHNRGVYLEVVPNEKLVFTDTYTTGWKPAPDPFMTAIVTFEDIGDGRTRYTAVARHRNADAARSHREMGFHDGWGKVATQLAAYARGLMKGPGADAAMKGPDADAALRTIVIERLITAPVATIWRAWMTPESLPQWWGPDGFSCRTRRIDLRQGGDWVFDMIGPDGTVYPNHHHFTLVQPETRIDYVLRQGENGPKHADARVTFEDIGGATRVTLRMTFLTAGEYAQARDFGAVELGQQTLGKLARIIGAG